jgi:hypothetical protein
MLDRKYIKNYHMTYLAFQGLLLESMPYIVWGVVNWWIMPPLDPRITLKVVIFRLAHGHSCKNMVDRFDVVASTIRKYTKIIVNAIAWQLFHKYIQTPSGERLCNIIEKFWHITIMQNMAKCIWWLSHFVVWKTW